LEGIRQLGELWSIASMEPRLDLCVREAKWLAATPVAPEDPAHLFFCCRLLASVLRAASSRQGLISLAELLRSRMQRARATDKSRACGARSFRV